MTYHVVLISSYSHELRFRKHESFHMFGTRSQGTSHCALLLIVKYDVKTRLVLMHGVEYNLETKITTVIIISIVIVIVTIIIIIIIRYQEIDNSPILIL